MWIKALLLFFVFSYLFRTDLSFDQDLGRHIKLGEIIVNSKSIPKVNLFSYTNPDFPFINTHWGFEVIAYFFSQHLTAFLLLKVIIFLFSVLLILKLIPKDNLALVLPIGFIFLHVLRERLELRPEIFSFLYTALTYYTLEKYLKVKTKLIFLLPIIQLIWINTHIYFFTGLILQVIFIIHLTFDQIRSHLGGGRLKFLSIIFILSVLISLINPNGLNGLLYPLVVRQNYGYTIVENQTMFLLESINFNDPNILFVKISLGILVLALAFSVFKRKLEIKNALLSLAGAGLALLNVRSFPYLVFLSLPAVIQNFGGFKPNIFTKLLTFLFLPILLLESFFYLNGEYYKPTNQHNVGLGFVESGKGAMDFVIKNNLSGPIFNNFDIGSYITYRGYPKYRIFVDGRPEAYPVSFFTDIYMPAQSDFNKFKALEKEIGFKTIIFSHTDQTPWGKNFLQNIVKDESWKIVYLDDFMIVLSKEGRGINLSQLSPDSYQYTNHLSYLMMGIFLINTDNLDSAKQFILKSKSLYPESPVANSILGDQSAKNPYWW